MARILVIDDVQAIRLQLRLLLEQLGHRIEEAEDGAVALEKLKAGKFDLMITDVVMPTVDGVELVKKVREDMPDMRIIAISGGGSKLSADWSLRMTEMFGANVILQKPFDNSDMRAAVEKLLNDG
jgi:CheY-like chemotaxis protein